MADQCPRAIRRHLTIIFEWWHNRESEWFDRALRFADQCWIGGRTAQASQKNAASSELHLDTLAIAFLWRAFLVDFGRISPGHTDGWTSIAEWIDFDVWKHYSV